jgi:hypothetical protein
VTPSFIARSIAFAIALTATGLFVACGSAYSATPAEPTDAGGDATDAPLGDAEASAADDGATDAGTGPRCDPSKAWGAPALVTSLDTPGNDFAARLIADETLVFLVHYDTLPAHVYVAQRAGASGPFGPMAQVPALNTPTSNTRQATPTRDGLTVYFLSDRNDLVTGALSLFVGTRPSLGSQFTVTAITTVPSDLVQPYVTPSGATLYYVSAGRVWSAPIVSGAVGAGMDVGLPAGAITPVVSPDELTVFFAALSATDDGGADYDVYTATRASTAALFDAPSVVPGVNTPSSDYPSFVSADGCELWLSSTATTNGDIYLSTKPL